MHLSVKNGGSGTLDGQNMALNSEGFSIPQKCAQVPHRLILPEPVRSIRYATSVVGFSNEAR